MANADKELDEYIKKKLFNHEVKPSQLAWERLESRLPNPEKKSGFPFLGIAASFIVLIGLGYLIWFSSQPDTMGLPELAELKQEIEQPELQEQKTEIQEVPLLAEELGEEGTEPQITVNKEPNKSASGEIEKSNTAPKPNFETLSKQIADIVQLEEMEPKTGTDLYEIELPELDLQETLAEAKVPEMDVAEEQGYSIKIISNGFTEESKKEGLIEEIETKIEKIGGILNRVDQGFADLQDAKNNLFTTITTRKEKSN